MKITKISISKLFVVIVLLSSHKAHALSKKDVNQDLTGIKVVKIDVPGTVKINPSDKNVLNAGYAINRSGDIWGFSNKDTKAEYKPVYRRSNDTLYIIGEQIGTWAVGMSTYKETLEHTFFIPTSIRLVIESHGTVNISSSYKQLICNNSEVTNLIASKNEIYSIKCVAKKTLKVNATEKTRNSHATCEYEFEGIGKDVCVIYSDSINLILK